MLFNSFVFPVFLLIVLTLYYILKHRPQNALLVVASYVFYGWWDWRFLFLLWISTITDYYISQFMEKVDLAKGKRLAAGASEEESGRLEKKYDRYRWYLLLVSLTTSLGILGFFKYFNFFSDSTVNLLTFFGLEPSPFTLKILLPVGISFYTFQTMAYTIDVYRRKEKACRNFIDFALYVAYFPQLVAGPIERSQNLLPQFQKARSFNTDMFVGAFQLILMGYFKKVFIADGVAPIVNACFDNPGGYGGWALLLGSYLFALQIYGDFAGYTDIARGVSRLFGIEMCLNFRQPYLASNITDFWRRWHISLSSWLRDYLYIPLGGNRKGKFRTYLNNMITMLLGGLWHGAAWQFVIWGGLHGAYLAVHKLMLGDRKADSAMPSDFNSRIGWLACIFGTFNLVCFAWIFFRADTCMLAFQYIRGILAMGTNGYEIPLLYVLFYGACTLVIDVLCYSQNSEVPFTDRWWSPVRGIAYGFMLFLLFYIGENDAQPFIYFQF